MKAEGQTQPSYTNLESTLRHAWLFRLGWWLFFAGSPFLGWNTLGILLLLGHAVLDRRALVHWWRLVGSHGTVGLISLGSWRLRINYVLVALGMAGLVSSALAVEPGRAMLATVGMMLSIAFGLVYSALLERVQPGWYRAYLWPAVVAGASHMAWVFVAAAQLDSLWHRVETIGGPNGTGTLMLISLVLGLPWFASCRDWRRWLRVPYAAAGVLATLLTQSRGSWLGLAAFAACLLVPALRDPSRRRYAAAASVGAALLLAVAFASVPGAADRLQNFFNLAGEGRVAVYHVAWDMFVDNFWLGVGPANFGNHWDEYNRGRSSENIGFPHNTWLQVLTETGIIGGILFAAIIARILTAVWRLRGTRDWVLWVLAAAVVAILVRDQVDTAIFSINVGFVFWWLAGTVLAAESGAGARWAEGTQVGGS